MKNRIIKFRAWLKSSNKMYTNKIFTDGKNIICGYEIHHLELEDIFIDPYVYHFGEGINPFILMQFIGFKDKEGVEIFEGDIIEYECWHGGIEHAMYEKSLKEEGKNPDYKERRVVLGHPHGHFITRKIDDIENDTYIGDTISAFGYNRDTMKHPEWKIIGNIYQNPELLIKK